MAKTPNTDSNDPVTVPLWLLTTIVENDYKEYERSLIGLDEEDADALPFPEYDRTHEALKVLEEQKGITFDSGTWTFVKKTKKVSA